MGEEKTRQGSQTGVCLESPAGLVKTQTARVPEFLKQWVCDGAENLHF